MLVQPQTFRMFSFLLAAFVTQLVSAQAKFQYSADSVSWSKLTLSGVEGSPSAFSVELNGDGALDLAILGGTWPWETASGGKRGKILFNNGDNTFTEAEGDAPMSESARYLLIADFNGDQILDIYVADHGWDAAPFPGFPDQLLLGTGTGFVDESARLPAIAGFTHNGAFGDIDGDGDIDIFALNADQIEEELSYILINDGNANFEMNRSRLPASVGTLGKLKPSYGAELADLDGDLRPDLIVGRANYTGSRETTIYWNNGQGQFTDTDSTQLPSTDVFGDLVNIAVIDIRGVDVDNDGRLDVFVNAYNADPAANFTGISMQLFMNKGNRTFQDEAVKRLGALVQDANPARGVPYFIQFVDVNGDGITDILPSMPADTSDTKLFLFEGRGQGCFTPIITQSVATDSDVLFRLGNTPVFSGAGIESVEVFGTDQNGERKYVLNTVPVTITAKPAVANLYDSCSGLIKTTMDAGSLGLAKLNFVIIETSPDILIEAVLESAEFIESAIDKMTTFDSATGALVMPELVIDGTVGGRNMVFSLVDPGRLIFRLETFE